MKTFYSKTKFEIAVEVLRLKHFKVINFIICSKHNKYKLKFECIL
jgi:hypothetical protein